MKEDELCAFIRAESKKFGVTDLSHRCELTIGGIAGFIHGKHKGVTMRTALCLLHAMGFDLQLIKRAPRRIAEVSATKPEPVKIVDTKFHNRLPRERSTFEEAYCLKCGFDDGVVEVAGHLQCARCGHITQDCCGD